MSVDRDVEVFRLGDSERSTELEIRKEEVLSQLAALPESKKFHHEKYFTDDPLFELFFVGTPSNFKYCLGIGRWRQMPYFSLIDFRNLQEEKGFTRSDRQLLNRLFLDAFDFMHREGRFTFFYATRIRPFPQKYVMTNGEMAPVRGIPVFDRYDFTLEAVVPVGATPNYLYQQTLIRMVDRKFDYFVKRGTLNLKHLVPYIELGLIGK